MLNLRLHLTGMHPRLEASPEHQPFAKWMVNARYLACDGGKRKEAAQALRLASAVLHVVLDFPVL